MPFTGSCHCGKLSYSVEEDVPTKALACNCSICHRRGALHHFTTPDKFTLRGSPEDIADYRWNKKAINFEFCRTCGCAPFAHGIGPSGPAIEINLRCVDGIDLDELEISHFDGAHLIPGPE
ncbi:GFA family protein [Sphingosinicella sp. CPCC 101087]|uniref:GFA family protein n=1 Tax=Sphingosinicella sp. CPCC 101087 TaxID=2497754 RepID=UPI00101DD315|nr:GFA family protein [Sphingosinicella sp. CPCC 101087]